jgi:hypothetical protein
MRTKPQLSMNARTKELSTELSALLRQQFEALEASTFIRMNEEEAAACEQRSQRIAEPRGMPDGASRL